MNSVNCVSRDVNAKGSLGVFRLGQWDERERKVWVVGDGSVGYYQGGGGGTLRVVGDEAFCLPRKRYGV